MNESAIPKGWIRLGPDHYVHPSCLKGLRPTEPEQASRLALVKAAPREAKSNERFEVCFIVYAVRPCDWDNYFTKPLQDCLRAAGFIPDDDWRTLQGRVITRKARTRAEERTEITITAL